MMEDFDYYSVVLRLASASATSKLLLLDSADSGNKAVKVVTIFL